MRRRSRILVMVAGLALCPVLAAWGLALYALRTGRVNAVNFARVQRGLSEDGVERLFGRPGRVVPERAIINGEKLIEFSTRDGGRTCVFFPADGGACVKCWEEGSRSYIVALTPNREVWRTWDVSLNRPPSLRDVLVRFSRRVR